MSPSSGLKIKTIGYVSQKRWYLSASPHGVTTQKTNNDTQNSACGKLLQSRHLKYKDLYQG
jgi:hypothetical protein